MSTIKQVIRLTCNRCPEWAVDCANLEQVQVADKEHALVHADADAVGRMVEEHGVWWGAQPGQDYRQTAEFAMRNKRPFFYHNGNILTTVAPQHTKPVCRAIDVPNYERD